MTHGAQNKWAVQMFYSNSKMPKPLQSALGVGTDDIKQMSCDCQREQYALLKQLMTTTKINAQQYLIDF